MKKDFDDDGAAPEVTDVLGDVHVCRVNWAESRFVIPFADAAFYRGSP